MIRKTYCVAIFALIGACATAHLTAFRDPAYADKQFGRLAVFAIGMRLDAMANVERAICDKIAPTSCARGVDILPPTRKYTADDLAKVLAQWNMDGVLIVTLASDQAASAYAGTITQSSASATATTNGSANLYGNFGIWNTATTATATEQSTSTPVYTESRKADGYVALYDRASGAMAWGGEFRVSGEGSVAVTDREFIRAATKKIGGELRASGLLK